METRCEIFGVFFSSRSLKTRENCIRFAQFVYFLREVCLLFNFWMTNWAKLIYFSLVLREQDKKKQIFRTPEYSDGHDCFWTICWWSNEFFIVWYQACFDFWSYPICVVLHDDMCVVLNPWIHNRVRKKNSSLWFSSFVKSLELNFGDRSQRPSNENHRIRPNTSAFGRPL